MTRRELTHRLALGIAGVLLPLCASATEFAVNELVTLGTDYFFRVETGSGHEVSVSFYYSGSAPENLIERYSYTNGAVLAGGIRTVELDASNDAPEFLVTINDRTSNYGAAMGVLLWKRGSAWRLVKIPYERFSVSARDGSNVIDIDGRSYRFEQGFFLAIGSP